MSSDPREPEHEAFQRIAPRKPPPSPETSSGAGSFAQSSHESGNGISGKTLGVFLGVTLALATALFWVLSSKLEGSAIPKTAESTPESTVDTAVPERSPNKLDKNVAASPVDQVSASDLLNDAKALQARAAAQQARANFEDQLSRLQDANAKLWADAELDQARTRADAGAQAYKGRDFETALKHYTFANNLSSRLIAEIPDRLKDALNAGYEQLENGDKPVAQAQFELALKLSPKNDKALKGLKRVAVFDQVSAKLQTARRLEEIGDLSGARSSYEQALALDPDSKPARQALARLAAAARQSEFEQAMGAAISALDRGAYDTAGLRLDRARKLKPNSKAVKSAQTRLAEARRVQKIENLQREAAARVAEENWAGAVQSYRNAQKIDANIGFAATGLAIAEPRAQLAADLKDFANRPERLVTDRVAQQARRALAWAKSRNPIGPRLSAQIRAVEAALADATKPVQLLMQSDGQTTVEIYKVGNFGSFTRHSLTLQPGRYIAVGSRPGYRDIRKDINIPPGGGSLTLDIRCTEPI